MTGDAPYRRLVNSLYVLMRTASIEGRGGHGLAAAATRCAAALHDALRGDNHFILQERSGALFANGVQLRLDVESYAAIEAVRDMLVQANIGELLLLPETTANDLIGLAVLAAGKTPAAADPERALQALGVHGLHANTRTVQTSPSRPEPARGTASGNSHLRAVFVQNELLHAVDPRSPFAGRPARTVLTQVVDRLLLSPAGLEAVVALAGNTPVLAVAVHVCTAAALLAHTFGCPDPLVEQIAAAALLHDLGQALPPDATPPPVRACRWLLRHGGNEPIWLRCAFVARTWAETSGSSLPEAMAAGSLTGALVRAAARFDELQRRGGAAVADAIATMRSEAAGGAFPPEIVDALDELLAVTVPIH